MDLGKNSNYEKNRFEIIKGKNLNSDDTDADEEEFELDTVDEEKLLNSINPIRQNNYYEYQDSIKNSEVEVLLPVEELKLEIQEVATNQDTNIKEIEIHSLINSFDSIVKKYNINKDIAHKIESLSQFKTVYILDDSTSMNNILEDSPLNNQDYKVKRWEELLYFSQISIEVANIFNDNYSSDVYFLNREPLLKVNDLNEFSDQLKLIKPRGYTPLNTVLQNVIDNNLDVLKEKKLLVQIITDGEPTNDIGQKNLKEFYQTLKSKNHDKVFITMIACTDDPDSTKYLAEWDKQIKHFDFVDDYRTVKNLILKSKGPDYQFSYGDYVVKAFVGSFDVELDEIDDKKSKLYYAIRRLKNLKLLKR